MQEATKNVTLLDQKHLNLEFASYPDGKEAVAKAANVLFVKYYLGRDQKEKNFTESHVAEALRTVGLFCFVSFHLPLPNFYYLFTVHLYI